MQHDRHWSVEEANAAIATIGPRIDRLRELLVRLEHADAADAFAEIHTIPGGGWPGKPVAEASLNLALGLMLLEDSGIVVRDLERGLIDFPTLRDGEEVYLCWLREEPAVTHWHSPDAGFAGRRPL